MKKITLILLIFSTLFSCNNEEKLNKKIIELEAKNKILNDSFNKMMQNAIEQSKVKLTSETNDNSIKINGQWLQFSKLPKYNLYKMDNLKPVSYTHLDVYKRQHLKRLMLSSLF